MPRFKYRILTIGRQVKGGVIHADSREHAVIQIRNSGSYVLELIQQKDYLTYVLSLFNIRKDISPQDVIDFCSDMAILLQADIPMNIALNLVLPSHNTSYKALLLRLITRVERGLSLGQAMEVEDDLPNLLWQSLRVAEEAGAITEVLTELASYLKKEEEQRQKTSELLFYPKVIFIFALIITIFILVFLMPSYLASFENSGIGLPLPTRILVMVWNIGQNYFWIIFPVLFVLIVVLLKMIKSIFSSIYFQEFVLKIPLIGDLETNRNLALICQSLSILLKASVPVEKALLSIEGIPRSPIWRLALSTARRNLRKGEPLSSVMGTSGLFPARFIQLLTIGENSGNLLPILNSEGKTYEKKVRLFLNKWNELLQPIAILGISLFVGGLALALLMPLYTQLNIVQNMSELP